MQEAHNIVVAVVYTGGPSAESVGLVTVELTGANQTRLHGGRVE